MAACELVEHIESNCKSGAGEVEREAYRLRLFPISSIEVGYHPVFLQFHIVRSCTRSVHPQLSGWQIFSSYSPQASFQHQQCTRVGNRRGPLAERSWLRSTLSLATRLRAAQENIRLPSLPLWWVHNIRSSVKGIPPANQEVVVLFSLFDSLVAELQGLLEVSTVQSILDLLVPALIDGDGRHCVSELYLLISLDIYRQCLVWSLSVLTFKWEFDVHHGLTCIG